MLIGLRGVHSCSPIHPYQETVPTLVYISNFSIQKRNIVNTQIQERFNAYEVRNNQVTRKVCIIDLRGFNTIILNLQLSYTFNIIYFFSIRFRTHQNLVFVLKHKLHLEPIKINGLQ